MQLESGLEATKTLSTSAKSAIAIMTGVGLVTNRPRHGRSSDIETSCLRQIQGLTAQTFLCPPWASGSFDLSCELRLHSAAASPNRMLSSWCGQCNRAWDLYATCPEKDCYQCCNQQHGHVEMKVRQPISRRHSSDRTNKTQTLYITCRLRSLKPVTKYCH